MDNPTRPPKGRPDERKKTTSMKFAEFLRKYRIPILVVFGLAILAVLGVAIGTWIQGESLKTSTARLEKLESDYSAYSSETDAAKKADLEKSLLASADDLVKKYPRIFAAHKALAYKAKIEASKKDWAASEKDWLSIVAATPDSYLAPIALQGAAQAAEELGANDRAVADYKKLIDSYSKKSVGIPHAYFALGRLDEEAKDYAAALAAYQKIVSTWPDDDWTKLANDRIIFLKSSGLTK
jgi:tetratricopeptide (TPR) repeat protein